MKTAILLKRYKRFLADVENPDGSVMTIHCPNTGAMTNCSAPGSRIWYSTSSNRKRKYAHTWEFVETAEGDLAGVNTSRANQLVRMAIETGIVTELTGYTRIQQEVPYGEENSRIDLLLTGESAATARSCYVEVKNVTLRKTGAGVGLFPDAVTERGTRHLRELMATVAGGHRAVLFFCVQHTGICEVRPADSIDPVYGLTLRQAWEAGVEIIAYAAEIDPPAVVLTRKIAVVCP